MDPGLDAALSSGDAATVEDYLAAHSGLPGPRLNLALVGALADAAAAPAAGEASAGEASAAGTLPGTTNAPAGWLEPVLARWLALTPERAPGDQPRVILPCAAAVAYGALAVTAPDRFDEADNRLYRAASDRRWRVREAVTLGLQRMLRADWDGTVAVLLGWAEDEDLLVVRAAAAAVAEPRLLKKHKHAKSALEVQHRAVDRLHAVPAAERRTESVRVLRQALGFTVSVAVAATGDFTLLHAMAATGDPDLAWAVHENVKKSRLAPWPDELARLGG
ncbi:MAG TPA: hypothetical protein VEK80_04235 [Kribbellaceae bacterium]|nr:hypothetical protein [Kribbellaceae bacterium]